MFDDLFPSRHGLPGLSLFEVNEVIRRRGHAQGFEVIAEYPLVVDGHSRKVDWVWRNAKGQVVRAFEIEGANVPQVSLSVDIAKFQALRAAQARPAVDCWVVTYSVRFVREAGWVKLNGDAAAGRLQALPRPVRWVKDTDLIQALGALV